MPAKLKIEIWKKYWKLTITRDWWKSRHHKTLVECNCDCWNIWTFLLSQLINWMTKSCWCYQREMAKDWSYLHWFTWTRIHNIWKWIIKRCSNWTSKVSKYYYDKWISFDSSRLKFTNFYEDMLDWYWENLTIDRIDVNWNYTKENCRRITIQEQLRNRSNTITIEWMSVKEYSIMKWIPEWRIYKMIKSQS